jgi:hypothetical protein
MTSWCENKKRSKDDNENNSLKNKKNYLSEGFIFIKLLSEFILALCNSRLMSPLSN